MICKTYHGMGFKNIVIDEGHDAHPPGNFTWTQIPCPDCKGGKK